MVIVLNHAIRDSEKSHIRTFLEERGFRVREIVGEEETIFGAVGLVPIDLREVEVLQGVERVIPITKPYKLASREFKKSDSVVSIGSVKVGGSRIVVAAGPCAIESKEQIEESAAIVKNSGGGDASRGCLQATDFSLLLSGSGRRGTQALKRRRRTRGNARGLGDSVTRVCGSHG